jgi:hypothetical protein
MVVVCLETARRIDKRNLYRLIPGSRFQRFLSEAVSESRFGDNATFSFDHLLLTFWQLVTKVAKIRSKKLQERDPGFENSLEDAAAITNRSILKVLHKGLGDDICPKTTRTGEIGYKEYEGAFVRVQHIQCALLAQCQLVSSIASR